ncbi:MAG: hypothetical protein FJ390_02245 [Verrucomicrobia bacterium]|nr:hypothetical protein [Verrucomicrobiota bacterium]
MSVSQIGSAASLPKNFHINQNAAPSPEDVAAFEASLGEASEAASENNQNSSQENSDPSVPAASWDAYWKGFNQSIFDHDRRVFAYHDQARKEIDYGNKP